MDLQTTFYAVGIVFMGLMLILFVVLVVSVLVIRAKVNSIHRHLEDKLGSVISIIENGTKLVGKFKDATNKKSN